MKVAVIGGGVSGLASCWALNEYSGHEVHLFESGPYVGGHTNTQSYTPTEAKKQEAGKSLMPCDVDTGFIVFNTVTYPNFLRFVQSIGADIIDSDMSFAVSRHGYRVSPKRSKSETEPVRGWFEWAGGSPAALFCQSTNLLNPGHWRMVWDIIRFNQQSLETLRAYEKGGPSVESMSGSIGEWLDARGYGQTFRRNYLIPMTASIWSTPPSLAFSSFPAVTLLRFMHNHHLLQILDRPQWLTLRGGSKTYVKRVLAKMSQDHIHQDKSGGGKVVNVERKGDRWTIKTAAGYAGDFDRIIFATHADTALSVLEESLAKGDKRREVLSNFQFSKNQAVLHGDERLMPVRRSAWSAWNFIAEERRPGTSSANTAKASPQDEDRVALTYWMNLLQALPEEKHGLVLVTLNPPEGPSAPRPELVVGKFDYEHPIYSASSVRSQRAMKPLQGKDGLYFAGAWLNYGFHEDGFSSGLRAAESLGATLPFDVRSAERDLPERDWALTVIEGAEQARRTLALLAFPMAHFAVTALCMGLSILAATLGKGFLGKSLLANLGRTVDRVQIDWDDSAREDKTGESGVELWHRQAVKKQQ